MITAAEFVAASERYRSLPAWARALFWVYVFFHYAVPAFVAVWVFCLIVGLSWRGALGVSWLYGLWKTRGMWGVVP